MEFELVDTFPAFLDFWEASKSESLERQIKRWETHYLSQWPELRRKVIGEYRRDHVDWHQIARNRIFPQMRKRLPAMNQIHDNLVSSIGPVFRRAASLFDVDFEPLFVIYVGIGIGAGWGTRFGGRRAVLFGLENAAEMGWTQRWMAEALMAHELGHLLHQELRARANLAERPKREGPYWRMYEEGYATRFESEVTGHVGWPTEPGWLEWCKQNRGWLAAAFLRTVRRKKSARRFFGSWYKIRGHAECGYFLGYEAVGEWKRRQTLPEIAVLSEEDVRRWSHESLVEMACMAAKPKGRGPVKLD